MDNSDLLRGLSSTTVQIFGIALIVLILALTADAAVGRPVALIAALVMLAIAANWVAQGIWRAHPDRRHHGHR